METSIFVQPLLKISGFHKKGVLCKSLESSSESTGNNAIFNPFAPNAPFLYPLKNIRKP